MNLYRGPVYDLGDGTKLHDVNAGCWHCCKRLAEVIFDPTYTMRVGDFVCLDCGQTYAPAKVLVS